MRLPVIMMLIMCVDGASSSSCRGSEISTGGVETGLTTALSPVCSPLWLAGAGLLY